MTLIAVLVVAVAIGFGGCTSQQSDLAACDAYLQSISSGANSDWTVLASPPTKLMNSAVARLPNQFAASRFPKDVDEVWYEDGTHRLGVCTLAGSPKCAMGFFVYSSNGLGSSPTEATISMSCGPL
jgi:hypothetical protein